MRGGETCTVPKVTTLEKEIVENNLTFDDAIKREGARVLVSCGIDGEDAVNDIKRKHREKQEVVTPKFGRLKDPKVPPGGLPSPPPLGISVD